MDNKHKCSDCGKCLTFEEELVLGFICEECALKSTSEALKEEGMA